MDPAILMLAAVLSGVAAVAVAAALLTARGRRQQAARSLSAIDFVRSTFASRLRRREPLDELLKQMAEALFDAFRLDSAEVWMAGDGALQRVVSDPNQDPMRILMSAAEEVVFANARVSGNAWASTWLPLLLPTNPAAAIRVAPVAHQGALLGLIVIYRLRDATSLAAEADETLQELAREVGPAWQNARLDATLEETLDQLRQRAAELQASRARIVEAADSERRRIERDLHDGAQQHLVAVAVKTQLARQLLQRDPARARSILEELSADVEQALDELRDLAHGIYPPLLGREGLAAALQAAGRRSSMQVNVEAEGIGRYPPAVEAAVYFSCVEALQNVAKYAGPDATTSVRLREEGGALVFEVTDDGAGFDPAAEPAGAGLTNIRDRIGAVGGTVRIQSSPGKGTRLSGAVPLQSMRSASQVHEPMGMVESAVEAESP